MSTLRGVSNPLVFHVGQLPEICRKPMLTATLQVLGKEEQALRKRPADEVEQQHHVALHGQRPDRLRRSEPLPFRGPQGSAAGDLRPGAAIDPLHGRRGARLVPAGDGRCTTPSGKELAYDDDYRFKPDPVIFFEVPKDGEYTLTISDAIYRGREDFVYRVTIGELPFVTSIFPLGRPGGRSGQGRDERLEPGRGRVEAAAAGRRAGHPLDRRQPPGDRFQFRCPSPWTRSRKASRRSPTTTRRTPQKVTLPMIINGRIDRKDDWDVFQFSGRAGRDGRRRGLCPPARFAAGLGAQDHRFRRQAAGL